MSRFYLFCRQEISLFSVDQSVSEKHLSVEAGQIGVIAAYAAQRDEIRAKIGEYAPATPAEWDDVRIATVDGFQGSESDLIILSLARDDDGEVGFLRDPRRVFFECLLF